jgi:hypothetical protein
MSRTRPNSAWPVNSHHLPAWAPGPKTWAWAGKMVPPHRPVRPAGQPATSHRWIGIQRWKAHPRFTKPQPVVALSNPSPHPYPPLSHPFLGNPSGAEHPLAHRRANGAAELHSPELRATFVGAQPRRAQLDGAARKCSGASMEAHGGSPLPNDSAHEGSRCGAVSAVDKGTLGDQAQSGYPR